MANIASTLIGTSDDASLCKGLSMYPSLGSVNAGIKVNSNTDPFFDTNLNLLIFRISASASAEIVAGICGPAYGFKVLAKGEAEGSNLALELEDDEMEAGMFFGLKVGASIGLGVQRLSIDWVWDGWNSGIRTSWVDLFKTSLGIEIDILELVFELAEFLLKESGEESLLKKVENVSPALKATYGIVGEGGGDLSRQGSITVRPKFALPINLVELNPTLAALNKSLGILGGGVALGPQIGVSFPVTARVSKVRLESEGHQTDYSVSGVTNGALTGSTTGEEVEAPTRMSFEITHTPGLDITCGFFYSVSILKLFSVGGSIEVDLLNAFGFGDLPVGSFTNMVGNTIGQERIGRGAGGVAKAQEKGLRQVVLAPPALAHA
ncbi:hypothetical protein EON81_06560 [bacterium]|nr:MAG: hypothetical protein EON81_06560 [bacterium]